ncbi:MAG: CotH kinase family protein [Flavobacteriales bacterium]|nr:CotH kinase family protein [Flavobacteriales bacterium]
MTFKAFTYKTLWVLLPFAILSCNSEPVPVVVDGEPTLLKAVICNAEEVSGKTFVNDGYSFSNGQMQSEKHAHSGQFSCKVSSELEFCLSVKIEGVEVGNYVELSVWRYSPTGKGKLHVSSEKVGDLHYLVGNALVIEDTGWEKIVINVPITEEIDVLKVACYNPNQEAAYFDDLSIKVYSSRPVYYEENEALSISIDEWSFETLRDYRDQAMAQGIIAQEFKTYVPAKLTYKGKVIPVKLRFKGDWTDHLQGDKWSFRIKVDKGYAFKGLKSFSVQSPHTRSFLKEWFLHQMFENEGLLATKYDFIPLTLNGKNLGVFAIEEHFDKQLLEAKGRREGPILKMDEEGFWERNIIAKTEGYSYSIPYYEAAAILPFKKGRTIKNKSLRKRFLIAQNLAFHYKTWRNNIAEVFDIKALAQYHALLDIGKVHHGQVWHNQRIYYNPITSRLEPIAYDLCAEMKKEGYRTPIAGMATMHGEEDIIGDRFLNYNVFNQPAFQQQYLHFLKIYSSEAFITAQVEQLQGELDSLNILLEKEFSGYKFDLNEFFEAASTIRKNLPEYESKVNTNSIQFEPSESSYDELSSAVVYYQETGLKAYLKQSDSSSSTVECINFHLGPLEIVGYSIKKHKDSVIDLLQPIQLDAYSLSETKTNITVPGKAARLFFRLPSNPDQLLGKKVVPWPYPTTSNPRLELEKPLSSFSKYISIKDSIITLKTAISLTEVLFIPRGYQVLIQAGTTIKLGNGGGVLSYSPVSAIGTENRPITVSGSGSSNYGFQVLTDLETSDFQYVNFSGLSTLDYKGWTLTGAVTVYKGTVTFEHCVFANNHCEDALNLINCSFEMTDCTVKSTFADGFDGDFCIGTIANSSFDNTGNDGLDFSGSIITITGSTITNPGDKAISGGEASTLSVDNCTITSAALGVVAKDQSKINIEQVNFNRCKIVYSAYQKKDEYGPAHIISKNCTLVESGLENLIGLGSTLTTDGDKSIGKTKLNIDSLYSQFQ